MSFIKIIRYLLPFLRLTFLLHKKESVRVYMSVTGRCLGGSLSFTVWVPGIKLRPSGLKTSDFIHGAIWLVPLERGLKEES